MKTKSKSNGTRARAKADSTATSTKILVDSDTEELDVIQALNAEAERIRTSKPYQNFIDAFMNDMPLEGPWKSLLKEVGLSEPECGEIRSEPIASRKTK